MPQLAWDLSHAKISPQKVINTFLNIIFKTSRKQTKPQFLILYYKYITVYNVSTFSQFLLDISLTLYVTPCYYPYLYIYLCLQLLHISKIHTKTKEVPSYLIFDVDQKIISQKIKEAKKYISKAKKRSQKEKK